MNLFTETPENGKAELPYRVRYKVLFDGSQSELELLLLKFLSQLDAQYLDSDEDTSPFRWNPIGSPANMGKMG
jgi:hypothetical protein